MANTTLFRSLIGALIPRADRKNEAGAESACRPWETLTEARP